MPAVAPLIHTRDWTGIDEHSPLANVRINETITSHIWKVKVTALNTVNLKSVRRRSAGRPPQHQAEDLHALYLQAALETFLAKGYAGSSIEEIARLAKASKMTLYRLYGTKHELFRRVVKLAIERTANTMQVDPAAFGSAREGLRELVQHLHDALTDPTWLDVMRLVIAEGARFPALARELRSYDRELMDPVEAFLRQADARGMLRIADPHAAAFQLAALASGGVRFLIHEPLQSVADKRAWIDAIFEFAWSSWRPDVAAPSTNGRRKP
jgi:AcrR family transcriptional regulator